MVHVTFKYTSLASNPSPKSRAQPPLNSAQRPLQVHQAVAVTSPDMGKAAWVVTKSWPRTPLLIAVRSAPHAEHVDGRSTYIQQYYTDCMLRLSVVLCLFRHASRKPSFDCVGSPSPNGVPQHILSRQLERLRF